MDTPCTCGWKNADGFTLEHDPCCPQHGSETERQGAVNSRPEIIEELLGDGGAIHGWFELTYAQYLTVPRSVLQSMPYEWQRRFVQCLEELDETIDWRPRNAQYWVQLRAYPKDGREHGRGVLVKDPLMDYQRGNRRIPHRNGKDV